MRLLSTLLIFVLGTPVLTAALQPTVNETVTLQPIMITGKSEAGNKISPSLGATTYRLGQSAIQAIPKGANAGFNEVLLRAPGVVQDSFGQVHVRGDHGNLQYRINDIYIPESIGGFGQELDTRFLDNVELITGALPAQYGLRTAGIVNIKTKDSAAEPRLELELGSFGLVHPSMEWGNDFGPFRTYFTGSYKQSDLGIENPIESASAIHDKTQQYKLFNFSSYTLDDSSHIDFMAGGSAADFQIPNTPGLAAGTDKNGNPFPVPGISSFNSAQLNETQSEKNLYGIIAYKKNWDTVGFQAAFFSRYSNIHFKPDVNGDLYFNGVASELDKSITAHGIQADSYWVLNSNHTLRTGLMASVEHLKSDSLTTVFNTDSGGSVTGNPVTIADNNSKLATKYSVYLQDEWQVSPAWTINAGARFDSVDAYINESQISPRLNTTFKVSDQTTIHAGYARYFTPPPTELITQKTLSKFDNTNNAPEVTTNDPVKSERADYFDIGFTHQLSKSWHLGVDAYYKTVDNLLDDGQFGQALIFSPFNYKTGKVYGVEASATYAENGWSGYVNLALSKATGREINSAQFEFSQEDLDYIRDHDIDLDHDQFLTGSFGLAYSWKATRIYGDVLYGNGLRKGFANTEKMPGYTTMNLGVSQYFEVDSIGKFFARADITNVFDAVYQLRDGSGIGVGAAQYGQRRAISVSVATMF